MLGQWLIKMETRVLRAFSGCYILFSLTGREEIQASEWASGGVLVPHLTAVRQKKRVYRLVITGRFCAMFYETLL
jgi:hypothetical protein